MHSTWHVPYHPDASPMLVRACFTEGVMRGVGPGQPAGLT